MRLTITFICLGLSTAALAAVDPVAHCKATKVKAVTKKVAAKGNCHSKAFLKGLPVDSACLTKAETKFTAAVAKADSFGTCSGTATGLESGADAYIQSVLDALECPGQVVGGACWLLSASGANCDDTCAAQGLVYDPATKSYAGSDGTLANCVSVMTALGASGPAFEAPGGGGIGCAWDGVSAIGRDQDPTTSSGLLGGWARACACQ